MRWPAARSRASRWCARRPRARSAWSPRPRRRRACLAPRGRLARSGRGGAGARGAGQARRARRRRALPRRARVARRRDGQGGGARARPARHDVARRGKRAALDRARARARSTAAGTCVARRRWRSPIRRAPVLWARRAARAGSAGAGGDRALGRWRRRAEAEGAVDGAAVGDERRLPPETFRLLRDLINEYCGIFFADDNAYIVHRRLQPRLEAPRARRLRRVLPLPALRAIRARARPSSRRPSTSSPPTRPTSSARTTSSAPSATRSCPSSTSSRPRGERLSVWSAGCSTGEEAYTIAMLDPRDRPLRRLGRAHLRQRHLAALPAHRAPRRLRPLLVPRHRRDAARAATSREADGSSTCATRCARSASFGQMNLLDDAMTRLVGRVDVIFCRNVLIYFDPASRREGHRHVPRSPASGRLSCCSATPSRCSTCRRRSSSSTCKNDLVVPKARWRLRVR